METPLLNISVHGLDRGSRVLFPECLLADFGIEPGSTGRVHCGNRSAKAVFYPATGGSRPELRLPRQVAAWFGLSSGVRVGLKKNGQDGLRLGPVIGVLTTDVGMAPGHPDLGICYSSLIQDVIRASRLSGGLVYAFKAKEVVPGKGYVIGYRPSLKNPGRWIRARVPLPDVVYNRVPNRTAERQPEVRRTKAYFLNRKGTQFFNRSFFDKWDVYELLGPGDLNGVIPETRGLSGPDDLREMISRHQMVYLKPQGGSLGKGVIRIIRLKNGGYSVRYRMGDRNGFRRARTTQGMVELVFSLTGRRRYIVQQGIWLARFRGRPFDFRVHLTRGPDGHWGLAGIGGKVAGNGSVTTHVHSGGYTAEAEEVASEVFGDEAAVQLNRIADWSIRLTKDLEARSKQSFGEVGLDVGVDHRGRIWLFEINSKPGRAIFDLPSLKRSSQKNWARLLAYCFHLAEFKGAT